MPGAVEMVKSNPVIRFWRRLTRRFPRLWLIARTAFLFAAAFSAALGFISGTQSKAANYDPHSFAIGISALFAVTCVTIALMSFRLRSLRKAMARLAQHNEALTDRNWELKDAEERARSLVESQGDLIVRRDAEGRVTFANDTFCTMAKRPRKTLVGSAFGFPVLECSDIGVQDDGTRVYDQKIETTIGPRWIAWREAWVRIDANTTAELQCVGRDVTDRVEAEHALGEARDLANTANRAKSRFLAMVSHEIRTPLNGILGMADLLLDTPLSAEQTTYARAVKTSGDTLLSLIEEVLDFSKIEAGRLDLEARPFALQAMVEDITELLAPRAHAKGLEIASIIDERLHHEVIGDEARLRQVLLNLAGNAIKFTAQGGVAIMVEPGIWPNEISFAVRDTGIGIAPDAQERIFHEFEQADFGTTRQYGGTGLGLAISKRIVERMGGRIGITSTPGEGSTFDICIPLPPADCEAVRPTPPDLTNEAIMLAAPATLATSLIQQYLQRWGAHVCVVADLDVARALMPERAWSAVIVDYALGKDVADSLAEAALSHTDRRLVLVTPAERHDLARLRGVGYTGYLVKPLRARSLAAQLVSDPDASADNIEEENSEMMPAQRKTDRPGLSILVAEDNEINALLARALLARLGHRPVISTNGEAAVESWLAAQTAGTPFDAVLMDVQMPLLDGIAATRQIREHEAQRDIHPTPIVALTASAMDDERQACLAAGMDAFLTKPLDREKLASIIGNFGPAAVLAA